MRTMEDCTGVSSEVPAEGFYQTPDEIFYATRGGCLYLIRGPGEPACLRARSELPSHAIPFCKPDDPALDVLASTAETLGQPPHLNARRAESRRDAFMVQSALLQDLLSLLRDQVGVEDPPWWSDVCALHDRLAVLLWSSLEATRRLTNERINRSGERPSLPRPPDSVPVEARPFLHRGAFVGGFASMEAAGVALAERLPPSSAPPYRRLRNAHLDGALWTLPVGGQILVFSCPGGAP